MFTDIIDTKGIVSMLTWWSVRKFSCVATRYVVGCDVHRHGGLLEI